MPIQLNWQTRPAPPRADSRMELGLEITGDETTLAAAVDGRVRLIEATDRGRNAGSSESATERLIATFHGEFHRDAALARERRVTFGIRMPARGTVATHSGDVPGFDPECMFGVDVMVLTFVNREFIIWLPFHVDSRSEGQFLEVVAVAETLASGGAATEIGRSSVLNLPIRRTATVDSTSNNASGNSITYRSPLCGHRILTQEHFILGGGTRDAAQSTAEEIVLAPGFFPVPPDGSVVPFTAYPANAMRIILMNELADDAIPDNAFLTTAITGVTNVATVRADARTRYRNGIQSAVQASFRDAGFTGAQVLWQDETAAAALVTAFTGAFRRRTTGGSFWTLINAAAPLVTSFWNFYVAGSDQIATAGEAEHIVATNTQRTINRQPVFLTDAVPVGGGNKSLTEPAQLNPAVFRDLLESRSGVARRYQTSAAFGTAVDQVAGKIALLISHEVAHRLGMMHHSMIRTGANASESGGSPVLSIGSADVDSGGFGIGVRFHSQIKVVWQAAFGVTATFSDTIFLNKTWTASEVNTLAWSDRTSRFLERHGEGSIRKPHLSTVPIASLTDPPTFAVAPPGAQRGTFIPPSSTP